MLSVREITKQTKTKAITRVKIGRNKKNVTKKLGREMLENRLLEEQCRGCTVSAGCNFATCENSQVAKFLNLRNFAGCEIFAACQIAALISLHFLLLFPFGL